MRHLVLRSLPSIVLTLIALVVSASVSVGTNLTLAWHEVTLIALGLGVIASIALALPPGIFRPLTSVGYDVSDIYIRTGEIERRTAHLEHRAGERRRYLWNLLPLTIAIAIVGMIATLN